MKTIKIEFGLDTATVDDNIDAEKYLKNAARELRALLPEYKFSCSVNEDDNAETKILNEDELDQSVIDRINEALVEAESRAINN